MKHLIKPSIILIILTWYLGFLFGIMGWCEENTGFKKEYKEWVFVNWHKDLTGGFVLADNKIEGGGYWLVDIDGEKQFIKNYFPNSSYKKLNDKWFDKPMPKGLKEFLEKYKIIYRYNLERVLLDIVDDVLPIIAMAESSNNPEAIGDDGKSIGLYQISLKVLEDYNKHFTYKDYIPCTKEDLFYAHINRSVATWFIRYRIIPALEKHNYPIDKVHIISLYNMGVSRGLKYIKEYGIPKNHGNRIYRKVFREYWKNK